MFYQLKLFFMSGAKQRASLLARVRFYIAAIFLLLMGSTVSAKTIIYIANADSQDIAVFQLDDDSKEPLLLQRYAVKGSVMPMALSPDKRLL